MLDTEMELAMRFDAQTTTAPTAWTTCAHCGRIHATTCPRIAAIEYHECGTVKRVELREPEPNVVPFTQFERPNSSGSFVAESVGSLQLYRPGSD